MFVNKENRTVDANESSVAGRFAIVLHEGKKANHCWEYSPHRFIFDKKLSNFRGLFFCFENDELLKRKRMTMNTSKFRVKCADKATEKSE